MPLCFAIMPITTPDDVLDKYGGNTKHFIRVAKHIFKPAAEAAGFVFQAPTSTSAAIIQAEIIEYLETADLVLCDISTWNANVFFELGIRVALNRPVVMVKDHLTNAIPFDNSMVNTYTYDGRMDVWRVEETVAGLAAFLEGAKTQEQNALWKYFGITKRAEPQDLGNAQDAKLELLLTQIAAIRREARTAVAAREKPTVDYYRDVVSYIVDEISVIDASIAVIDSILSVDEATVDITTTKVLSRKAVERLIAQLRVVGNVQLDRIRFKQEKAPTPYMTINLKDHSIVEDQE